MTKEALDNSQSLLAMIQHLGAGRPTGISSLDWDNEGLTKLIADQVTENRAAIDVADRLARVDASLARRVSEGAISNGKLSAENGRLRAALQGMVDNFRPFTMKPVGGPGSAARLDQEAQIKAHADALAALKQMPPPPPEKKNDRLP